MRYPAIPDSHILRVYYIYRCFCGGIAIQSGSWIDLQGCSDNQKYVRLLNSLYRRFYLRNGFTKPYDMRSELSPVRSKVTYVYDIITYIEDLLF